MPILRVALAAALMLVAAAVPGAAVWSAPLGQGQANIAMTAQAGFGDNGSYVINEWFPIRVSLVNPGGGPSLRVRVEVSSNGNVSSISAGSYAREVDLPSPSRKEITLYAYAGSYSSSFDVRLMQGNTQIKKVWVSVNALEAPASTVVGVVSSDAALLNVLRGEKIGYAPTAFTYNNGYGGPPGSVVPAGAAVTVAHMGLGNIPDISAALDSLAALMLDDIDTGSLTKDQHSALASWVARGGTLMVAERPGGASASSGLADLLPVKVGGTRSLTSLNGLGDLVNSPIELSNPVLVTNSTLRTDGGVMPRLLAIQDGTPLAATRDLGEGQVVYLALSPGLPPLKSWDGLVPLFKRLLAEHKLSISSGQTRNVVQTTVGSYGGYYGGNQIAVFDTGGGLFDLPALDLPEPLLLTAFMLVYIIIIGPLNFIILRRMRRPEMAWLTIPVLVVLFSIGAYVLAYGSKGGDLLMLRANVTRWLPGTNEAEAMQVWGMFSPLRGDYRVSVGKNSVVAEVTSNQFGSSSSGKEFRVSGGDTTTLDNVFINTSSLVGFAAQNTISAEPPLEADLRLEDNVIVGTIRNRTNGGLQDVALVRGGSSQKIGYMGSGSSAQVKLPITSVAFDNNSPTSLLPTPPGVSANNNPNGYYNSPAQQSSEQRKYNRKVGLLNIGLSPLVSADPPTDMSVLALAWGANQPVSLNVDGHSPSVDETNLWTARLPVSAGNGAKLKLESTPYWIYNPGHDPAWLGRLPAGNLLTLMPYADVQFRLPAGTKPNSMTLSYRAVPVPSDFDVLVYNARTGSWDRQTPDASAGDNSGAVSIPLLNPADYADAGGDVTVRFKSKSGNQSVAFSTLGLVLNDTSGAFDYHNTIASRP